MAHGETSPSWAARSGPAQTAEDISATYLVGAPENAA